MSSETDTERVVGGDAESLELARLRESRDQLVLLARTPVEPAAVDAERVPEAGDDRVGEGVMVLLVSSEASISRPTCSTYFISWR